MIRTYIVGTPRDGYIINEKFARITPYPEPLEPPLS